MQNKAEEHGYCWGKGASLNRMVRVGIKEKMACEAKTYRGGQNEQLLWPLPILCHCRQKGLQSISSCIWSSHLPHVLPILGHFLRTDYSKYFKDS